jgi:hypothetical protein
MASDPPAEEIVYVPLRGTRAQSLQRLQIGLAGLGAMVLLVGLANIIMDRAKQTDAAAVPEAATAVANEAPPVNDPLADAGVAPDVTVPPRPRPATTVDPNSIPAPPKH